MRKPTEYEIEQTIFLGGQVSNQYPEFKDFAKANPDLGFAIWYLKNKKELEQMEADKRIIKFLEIIGELEFLNGTTELTKLSMILGDTRKSYNVKKVIDELRKSRSDIES